MSRIERIKKAKRKTTIILAVAFLTLLIAMSVGIFSFNVLNPKELTFENAKEEAYRNVNIIASGDVWYVRETKSYVIHAITDHKEAILISAHNESDIEKFQEASVQNKIKATGSLTMLSEETVSKLIQSYSPEGIRVYGFMLTIESPFERYFIIAFIGLVLLLLLYAIISNNKRYTAIWSFFSKNPRYDYIPSEFTIPKKVDVVEKHLINMVGGRIVDLDKYETYEIKKHKKYFLFTTYITLLCRSTNGTTYKMVLPRLNGEEIDKLVFYLRSIGKKI